MADAVNGTITVNIVEADYSDIFRKKLKEITKTASIKGFRPGKVPVSLIEKMYGKGIVADAINELLDKEIDNFVKEQNLDIFSNPVPVQKELDFNAKEYDFEFKLGVIPPFELPDLNNFSVPTLKPVVNAERIEEVITALGKQYGTTTNPETIEAGDFVFGVLKNADGSWTKDTGFNTDTLLGDAVNAFLGKGPSDVVELDLQTAFSHEQMHKVTMTKHGEDVELTGTFFFEIEKINRTAITDMDNTFFDKVFPNDNITDEAAFKAKLEEVLQSSAIEDQNFYTSVSARKELVAQIPFELPVEFIKERMLADKSEPTLEQVEKELPQYLHSVRWSILLSRFSKAFNLEVQIDEVVHYTKGMIRDQFRQYGMANVEDDMLDDYVNRYLSDKKNNNLANMYERTGEAKITNFIATSVQAVVEEVPMEDFKTRLQQLQEEVVQ